MVKGQQWIQLYFCRSLRSPDPKNQCALLENQIQLDPSCVMFFLWPTTKFWDRYHPFKTSFKTTNIRIHQQSTLTSTRENYCTIEYLDGTTGSCMECKYVDLSRRSCCVKPSVRPRPVNDPQHNSPACIQSNLVLSRWSVDLSSPLWLSRTLRVTL